MATLTIGDMCSRIRGVIKAERQDSFVTDKFIYSLFKKYAATSIKRLDEKKRLTAFASIFEPLFVNLKELDVVEASECGVAPKSYRTIRRSCLPIPVFTEGIYGPMIRSITSVDGYELLKLTTPDEYSYTSKSKNFKYNTQKYAIWRNDYLYFPNIDWPAVIVDGMTDDDVSAFQCNSQDKCKPRQCHSLNVPDYLMEEIEDKIIKSFGIQAQFPEDNAHDNVNNFR